MPWLISDANIIIDMEVGGILEPMFRLPESFAVPDILYIEELVEQHSELPGLGLAVLSLQSDFVAEAYRLKTVYDGPSVNDLFALALAKQEKCPLLTGDKALRLAAESENVVVSGTLWLVERLFEENMVALSTIEEAYDLMESEGRRLPWAEVKKQVVRFRKA